VEPLIVTAGDLVEDVVVRAHGVPQRDGDVAATVTRHRGGSAANTAAAVARLGGRARFVGQVGADDTGDRLVRDLAGLGVDCAVGRSGVTGTVAVVVEPDGTRTMFSDRRAAAGDLPIEPSVLDDAGLLHIPWFGLADAAPEAPLRRLVDIACARGVAMSFDPSSVALADGSFLDLVHRARPAVVFCNDAEADALRLTDDGLPGALLVVVKRGAEPARITGAVVAEVPVPSGVTAIDTTGAGDAFAAGFLLGLARGEAPEAAALAGHAAAARVVAGPGADAWVAAGPQIEGDGTSRDGPRQERTTA
jgi:sugar/nucleoside kinase (ribokinase family)